MPCQGLIQVAGHFPKMAASRTVCSGWQLSNSGSKLVGQCVVCPQASGLRLLNMLNVGM